MRTALVLTLTAVPLSLLTGLTSAPAHAATGTEDVAFTVLTGTLSITPGAPAVGATASLSGGTTTATVGLGLTTVVDTRVASTGWAASANTTDFNTATGSGWMARTQSKFSVPNAPVSVIGTPAVTFSYLANPTAVDSVGTVGGLVVATAVGVNTGTFSPVLTVVIPNGSTPGAYLGVVTQTVV